MRKRRKKNYKCFGWALGFDYQDVKNYDLLRVLKAEDRQCYQFIKVTI